ncbi:CRISPR-associated helicase Cas3' [Rubellimicrobium rubrum]|uniref:CRISPR-associated helicase Cas3 n=2 Tax=Rubellimicrobium rubrum TaxID=2585369 RepID=A0A5C4N0A1_9RHOB|nr:CRISPR-associated helicase Cas3' [Rubellimicrobium rubrum]
MTYWAHSGSAADRSDWQPLPHHLHGVAVLAADAGRRLGIERAARLAALLHDLGKYNPAFQKRIAGGKERVDHSTAGGAILKELAQGRDRLVADLLAYIILGHHAGLPDGMGAGESGTVAARLAAFDASCLDPTWRDEIAFDLAGVADEVSCKVRWQIDKYGALDPIGRFDLSLIVRMIFSCLVDADRRDTEDHYVCIGQEPAPDRDWPNLQAILPDLIARFDTHMATKAQEGTLNGLRGDILAHARAKAALPPGLFTLTVPTGGGKTLASLGFALDHARAQDLRRIVYAIPYTSIIDQTASIFREVLGDSVVLEHHSAIEEAEGHAREGRDKLKLAMEDWAAPVVVTTNVQLFESLFAARPSRARKLHNLAGSIIVLDEAQTIPRPLLEPCVRAIDALANHWGCTVLLCTATQPAFQKGCLALPLTVERELAPDPVALASRLRRTRIERAGPMDDEVLVAALAVERQALVIVNSRHHALDLYRLAKAKAKGLDGLVHLTTRQCAAHRRAVLSEVRRRLAGGEPCCVVATSLVEAGVDLDFPRVWRAEAGLDSIIQAAGRCNREGRRPADKSIVTVFSTPGRKPPAEVAGLVADMARMMDRHDDLQSLAAIEDYFAEVYWRLGEGLDGKRVIPHLSVSNTGTDFAFRSIAENFRMVESEMLPVVVPYDEVARVAVRQLGVESITSGRLHRVLQTYLVQVSPKDRDALIRGGHVAFERPDLRGDQFAVLREGSGLYRQDVGLLWEEAGLLPSGGIL